MALSDERQRIMPTMDDRVNGQPLAFPEAILLTNPADS
jgi:rhamnogalacturonan endolyase